MLLQETPFVIMTVIGSIFSAITAFYITRFLKRYMFEYSESYFMFGIIFVFTNVLILFPLKNLYFTYYYSHPVLSSIVFFGAIALILLAVYGIARLKNKVKQKIRGK